MTSRNNLFNSVARFLLILKLQDTIPPNALIGSHARANSQLLRWFLFIETPHGLACFTITVPVFLGNVFEIVKAENMSL